MLPVRVHTLLVTLFTLTALARSVGAETFRWEDAKGQPVFGSRPPAGAKNVTRVNPITISRYSSNKVIKSFGYKAPPASESEEKPLSEETLIKTPAHLEERDLKFDVDGKDRVTRCEITLKNSGEEEATGVGVSFLLPDGSLVAAGGPVKIAPASAAVYEVPAEQLPLQLRQTGQRKPEEKPQVVIAFDQSGSVPTSDSFALPDNN